ncbi:hypothetical protein AnigIFM56816_004397 [Aspergillus niger]|nr:hypothetical protein AnigIFM56816_004397 [Aspergillus niger]
MITDIKLSRPAARTKLEHMAGMELHYSFKAGRLDERQDTNSVVAVVAVIGCQQDDTQTSEFLGMK